MTVETLQKALHLYLLTPGTDGQKQVGSVFCCDLLSLAMGRAPAGCAWVTVMGNLNTIAVASLAEVSCIVLAEGVTMGPDCIARAEENNIPVFTTAQSIFETAKAIDLLL